MLATVIDTLRYADRLKDAGFETRQAEAMARAINDEMTGGLATKDDVDSTHNGLTGAIDKLDAKLTGEIDKLDAKLTGEIEKLDAKLTGEIEKLDAKLTGEIMRLDARVEALDTRIDALDGKLESQGRHVFLVLGLIAVLGLYNALAPHFNAPDRGPGVAAPNPTASERSTSTP